MKFTDIIKQTAKKLFQKKQLVNSGSEVNTSYDIEQVDPIKLSIAEDLLTTFSDGKGGYVAPDGSAITIKDGIEQLTVLEKVISDNFVHMYERNFDFKITDYRGKKDVDYFNSTYESTRKARASTGINLDEIIGTSVVNGVKYSVTNGALHKARAWLTSGSGEELLGNFEVIHLTDKEKILNDFTPIESISLSDTITGSKSIVPTTIAPSGEIGNVHYHPDNILEPSDIDYTTKHELTNTKASFIVTDNGMSVFDSSGTFEVMVGENSKSEYGRLSAKNKSILGEGITTVSGIAEEAPNIQSEIINEVKPTKETPTTEKIDLATTPLENVQKSTNKVNEKVEEVTKSGTSGGKPESTTTSKKTGSPPLPETTTVKQPHTETKTTSKSTSEKGFLGKYGTAIGIGIGILAVAAMASRRNREDDSPIREDRAEENNPNALHHRAKEALNRFHKYGRNSFKRSSYDSDSNRSHAVVGAVAGAAAFGIRGRELFSNIAKGENILKGNNPAVFGKAFNSAETAWGIATGVSKLTRSNNAQDRASGVADIVNAALVPSAANRIVEAVAGKTKAGAGIELAKLGVQFGLAGATSYMARHIGMSIDKKGNKGYNNPTMEYKPTPDQSTDALAAHDSPGDFAMSMVTRDLPLVKKEMDKKLHHLINNGYAY